MPTIDDVAREAGVGIGTVSRVINHSPFVSEALRHRVQAAIDRLGYRPSPVARAFGGRHTRIFELLVPLFIGPIFLRVLRGIEEALADSHYTLLARAIENAGDRDRAFDACCRRGQSDGALVLWLTPPEAFVAKSTAASSPVVLLNVTDPRMWSVGVDHDASAHDAVDYCARLGHQRIALVDRPADVFDPSSSGLCAGGYRDAVATGGLAQRDDYEQKTAPSAAGGAAALQRLAELPERPSAIVAASDVQAIGIVQAARERGWHVPGDLSVVGYSDSEYAEYLGLTTIRVPVREIGHEATRVLLDVVKGAWSAPESFYQSTQLVVRRTCGPPSA